MLRQLLTILALVTGFAAVAQPARAAEGTAAVEAFDAPQASFACAPALPVLQLASQPRSRRSDGGTRCRPASPPAIVPTIELKVDRARE